LNETVEKALEVALDRREGKAADPEQEDPDQLRKTAVSLAHEVLMDGVVPPEPEPPSSSLSKEEAKAIEDAAREAMANTLSGLEVKLDG
jgi:hypothetical protein